MTDLFYSLLPILGVQLLAALAALFVFIHSSGRGVIRMLVVPLALTALFAAPVFFVHVMGYAVDWPLPREFSFLAYRAVVQGGVKKHLEVWVKDGSATRLYRTPYSKPMEQMLQDAAKGAKGGKQARITRKGKRWWPGDDTRPPEGGYELHLEDMPAPPKDAQPPKAAPQEDQPVTRQYSI